MAKNFTSFFITIILALLSESNEKKEVLEKIQKCLNEESIESTMKENGYLDFQVDLKEPNQSIIHIKTNSILLNLQLTLS